MDTTATAATQKTPFPAYYDKRLVDGASQWAEAGKPPVTPIYVRNRVAVGISLGGFFSDGQPTFKPVHDTFVFMDGMECLLEVGKEGWVRDYALCVNAAPDHFVDPNPGSTYKVEPEKVEKGLRLILAVDPTVSERVNQLLADKAQEVRQARVQHAVRKAYDAWAKANAPYGEEIARATYGGDTLMLAPDGRLTYRMGGGFGGASIARYEAGKGIIHVGFTTRDGQDVLAEFPTSGVGSSLSAKVLSRLRSDHDADYHRRFEEGKAALEAARTEAQSAPLEMAFPSGVAPIEKGRPEAKLPAKLYVGHSASIQRLRGTVAQWYDDAKEMARFLGYEMVGRESWSGTGASVSSDWLLAGGVSDPREIHSDIVEVDFDRGVMVVPASKMGTFTPTALERLARLTGRTWTAKPRLDPASISEYCTRIDERDQHPLRPQGLRGETHRSRR